PARAPAARPAALPPRGPRAGGPADDPDPGEARLVQRPAQLAPPEHADVRDRVAGARVLDSTVALRERLVPPLGEEQAAEPHPAVEQRVAGVQAAAGNAAPPPGGAGPAGGKPHRRGVGRGAAREERVARD